ncbi:hypothetical protein SK128_024159, partial [Halocaridina rubra]
VGLDEASKSYTVINTHRGLMAVTMLVYDISSDPAIFQNMMEQLIAACLAHFDSKAEGIVSADGSPYALGAKLSIVTLEGGNSVMFASRTLSDPERNCSQLNWKGPLHPHLYAYRDNVGTTQCIMDGLSCINNKAAVVVFLDLEKAFELANPAAILSSLAKKGVKGHLLSWVSNHVRNREARVKFQGIYQLTRN